MHLLKKMKISPNLIRSRQPMKFKSRIALASFFCIAFSTTTIAQEKENKEELGTEVVNVVKPYSPTISDAFKVRETPEIDATETDAKKEVSYTIFSVPVASTFTPAKGKAEGIEKKKPLKLYNNYATLGFGNYTTILGELYSNFQISRTDDFGLFFKHNSAQGDIDDIVLDTKFFDTKLRGNYTSRQRDLTYKAQADVSHSIYNWYGLPTIFETVLPEYIEGIDEQQSYLQFGLGGSVAFEENILEKVSLDIDYLTDSFSSSEFNVRSKQKARIPFADFTIALGGDLDYLSGSFDRNYANTQNISYSFLNFGLSPSLEYADDEVSVSIGLGAYLSLDSENNDTNFYVYPNINASYRLVDDILIVFGGISGAFQQNSYASFIDENPFVSPTLYIQPTHRLYDGFLGMKGKLTQNLTYSISGSYARDNNKALFVSNPYKGLITAPEGYELGNSFQVVYTDLTSLTLQGALQYEKAKSFSVGIEASYFKDISIQDGKPWNIPSIKASLNASYYITESLYGGASIFFVGERDDVFANTSLPLTTQENITLDAFVDLNAHFGYHINERLSVFVKGANLIGENYEKWVNYKVQGIQGLLGATYKFDW